ncbi:hypothetical protein T484DRAFT_1860142 [Baffinella frigidus]|nr:hypothetical protein T484DRAFT_1860142 [Cryptophyta sp. CCMP2293]
MAPRTPESGGLPEENVASNPTAIARRGSLPSFARSSQQLQKNSKRSPQPSAPSTPKGTPGVFVPRGANGASTPRGGVGAASSPQAASGRHAAGVWRSVE